MKTEEAVSKLQKALKNKKYRATWTANIAICYKDTYHQYMKEKGKRQPNMEDIHTIANKAAEEFLTLLSKK